AGARPALHERPRRRESRLMNGPLVVVFLAVIALTALLQAAFVGALAFGLRLGRRKMREAEEKFEAAVVPRIRDAARLANSAARLSEKSLRQARRGDPPPRAASAQAERHPSPA